MNRSRAVEGAVATPRQRRTPTSRADEVINSIKRMILEGVFRPGDRLPVEKELAESLGVSRGSLREGISALSILGVVDTRQGDGTYITNLDVSQLLAPMGFVVDLEGRGDARHVHGSAGCWSAKLPARRPPGSPTKPSGRPARCSTRRRGSRARHPMTTNA